MKRIFTWPCLVLTALLTLGFIADKAEAWDIVGQYEYKDKSYDYEATITVTRDYQINLHSSIVGGICGFDGQVRDKERKKIAKKLASNPKSLEVVAWNGEKGKFSEDFVFLFTPNSVVLKRGTTDNMNYYCGQRLQLPDESEVLKKVK